VLVVVDGQELGGERGRNRPAKGQA
jgi:hypothetical protein